MALLDDLKQAATPPTPAGFKPGVVFQGSTPVEVTTPPLPAMTEAGEFAQAVKDPPSRSTRMAGPGSM